LEEMHSSACGFRSEKGTAGTVFSLRLRAFALCICPARFEALVLKQLNDHAQESAYNVV
jgi:hypothetical protein